jgi:hypothetical protein
MNEHAVPVLIAFLTVAGVAAFLLRRALGALNRQQLRHSEKRYEPEQAAASKGDVV